MGVGLVAAMLVTPAATAYLLTRRLPAMMAVAAVVGAVSSVAGLYLSYYLDVASGAAVVLTATAVFVLAFVFAPRRGLVARRVARARSDRPGARRPRRLPVFPFRARARCAIVPAGNHSRRAHHADHARPRLRRI